MRAFVPYCRQPFPNLIREESPVIHPDPLRYQFAVNVLYWPQSLLLSLNDRDPRSYFLGLTCSQVGCSGEPS